MVKKIIMPKLGETMEEGEIIKWLKKEGDKVAEGEPLLEIATDKANMEIEATNSGFLKKITAREGEKVPVAEAIGYIADSMDEAISSSEGEATAAPERKPQQEEKLEQKKRIKASPLAKRLAKEKGVDLSKLEGTGPGGRIVKNDVLQAAKETRPERERVELRPEKVAAEEEQISLSRIEKVMGERMQLSKREIPHFYLTAEVDFSEAMRIRDDLLEEFEQERGVHLSYTDLLIKACARALHKFPRVNSHYKEGKAISFNRVNLGLAVAREQGLVVPVIKDAQAKSLLQIAKERTELVKKATEDKLSLDDMEGGTFTLSNLGMMQIKNFVAIINPPEVCLLATGEVKERPVVAEGEIFTAPLMEMTLSCDHRVVDGYLGSRFLAEVRKGLEKPALLLV